MESTNLAPSAPSELGQPNNSQISCAVIILQYEMDKLRKDTKKELEEITKKHKDDMDEINKNYKEEIKKLRNSLVAVVLSAQACNTTIVKILQDGFGLEDSGNSEEDKVAKPTLGTFNTKRQRRPESPKHEE